MHIEQQPYGYLDARPRRRTDRIDPRVWQLDKMRRALADRDVRLIYALLQWFGVSQRRIAAVVEQSQSEISEIITRGRQVASYAVIERIAIGFGIPRGWMGLAYDEETARLYGDAGGDVDPADRK
jgi:predicted XRE-type DNA-binding protein